MPRRLLALTLIVLVGAAGCIGGEEPPDGEQEDTLADMLDRLLQAQDRASRAHWLRTALDKVGEGPADQQACGRTLPLGQLGATLDEPLARQLVRLIGAMRCLQSPAVLDSVLAGAWLARSGVTRASALEVLCRGSALGSWTEASVDAIADRVSRDRSDFVRASAFEWLLRDRTLPEWPQRFQMASADESPWVRAVVDGEEGGPL